MNSEAGTSTILSKIKNRNENKVGKVETYSNVVRKSVTTGKSPAFMDRSNRMAELKSFEMDIMYKTCQFHQLVKSVPIVGIIMINALLPFVEMAFFKQSVSSFANINVQGQVNFGIVFPLLSEMFRTFLKSKLEEVYSNLNIAEIIVTHLMIVHGNEFDDNAKSNLINLWLSENMSSRLDFVDIVNGLCSHQTETCEFCAFLYVTSVRRKGMKGKYMSPAYFMVMTKERREMRFNMEDLITQFSFFSSFVRCKFQLTMSKLKQDDELDLVNLTVIKELHGIVLRSLVALFEERSLVSIKKIGNQEKLLVSSGEGAFKRMKRIKKWFICNSMLFMSKGISEIVITCQDQGRRLIKELSFAIPFAKIVSGDLLVDMDYKYTICADKSKLSNMMSEFIPGAEIKIENVGYGVWDVKDCNQVLINVFTEVFKKIGIDEYFVAELTNVGKRIQIQTSVAMKCLKEENSSIYKDAMLKFKLFSDQILTPNSFVDNVENQLVPINGVMFNINDLLNMISNEIVNHVYDTVSTIKYDLIIFRSNVLTIFPNRLISIKENNHSRIEISELSGISKQFLIERKVTKEIGEEALIEDFNNMLQ